MSEDQSLQKRNILLLGFGELHPNIKDYLAEDVVVKAWIDKAKYRRRTGAELTHDLNAFYRQLQIQKNALSIDYQYRKEVRSVYKDLMKYADTFMYIYSRKPIFNGENSFIDMMDAFHIYIHFFIDFLKRYDIHCIFSKVPHHADYVLYLAAKVLNIKTVFFLQSMVPGKSFMMTDFSPIKLAEESSREVEPIPIKRKERKEYFYMKNISKSHPYIKMISALLFRRDMDLFFHRLMNVRRERRFKLDYKNMLAKHLPSGKFVYFPLHFQPELTTHSLGGIFVDQMLAIECLRALLPDEWQIVVKENPKQTAHSRGSLFFARLAKIPNLSYVDQAADTFDLIEKSEFCATVTGTVGFEALSFGKRVLVFGEAMYKNFPGVIQYDDDLTFEDIASVDFSHEELELAYAKAVNDMIDVVIDVDYMKLVDNFSMKRNTRALADVINRVVRE